MDRVIVDYNNIVNTAEYGVKEKVIVGNGHKVLILHTGKSCLVSHMSLLNLESVLCVPDIAKNFVSVSNLFKTLLYSLSFMLILVLLRTHVRAR